MSEAIPYLKRNYSCHLFEGGLWMGGAAIVSAHTILPPIVKSLGGSPWIISMVPQLIIIGFLLPPIFNAHKVEQFDSFRPFIMRIGLLQRMPYLFAGLALLFLPTTYSFLLLAAVVLAPFLSGLFGGVLMTSWQQLMTNTIPQKRRSSLFSFRLIIGAVIGMMAGGIIKYILERFPGPEGYAYLHLIAFVLFMSSYFVFAFIKEVPSPTKIKEPRQDFLANIKSMPSLMMGNRPFMIFVIQRILGIAVFIIMPWISIHALHVLDKPNSFLGQLLFLQMLGSVVGNLFAGWIGDKYNAKAVVYLGRVVFLALLAWLCVADSSIEFSIIFLMYGFSFDAMTVGDMALGLEITPQKKRATYLSTLAFSALPFFILAGLVSKQCWNGSESMVFICLLTAIALIASIILLSFLPNTREVEYRS